MKILGLINARAGSKTVKNKNIKKLGKHPLIAWTIKTALKSKKLSDVVVSTDSKDISNIALKYGASIPFMRPNYLASDKSKQINTIRYVLTKFAQNGNYYDAVALLQPTFPLRIVDDIDKSINLMKKSRADTIISVVECNPNLPLTLYKRDKFLSVKPINKIPPFGTNRQSLPKLFARVGCIYLTRTSTIIKNKSIYGKKVKSILIPEERSFDIDTKHDWNLLEAWINKNNFERKIFI